MINNEPQLNQSGELDKKAEFLLNNLVDRNNRHVNIDQILESTSVIQFYELLNMNLSKKNTELGIDPQKIGQFETFLSELFTKIAQRASSIRETEAMIGATKYGGGTPSNNALPHLDSYTVNDFKEFFKREQIIKKIGLSLYDEKQQFFLLDELYLKSEHSAGIALYNAIKDSSPQLLEDKNNSELRQLVHQLVFEMWANVQDVDPNRLDRERKRDNLLRFYPNQIDTVENILLELIEEQSSAAVKAEAPKKFSWKSLLQSFFNGGKK